MENKYANLTDRELLDTVKEVEKKSSNLERDNKELWLEMMTRALMYREQ